MKIRATELKDLPRVMEIYDYSRAFMRTNGNVTQWIGGYPSEALIRQEIEDGHSFVCMDVFYFLTNQRFGRIAANPLSYISVCTHKGTGIIIYLHPPFSNKR